MPRPRGAMPAATIVVVLAIWGVIAHDAGAGWFQAIGALVAGTLLVGMVAPAVVVARARCRVVASPRDASVGVPVAVEVRSSSPVELTPLDPSGPAVMASGGQATLELLPDRRGVLRQCTVSVASAAPFGVLWWTRAVTLPLARPLAVSPRVGGGETGVELVRGPAETPLSVSGHGAEPRGVRPYAPGDRRTLVHWPATAHSASLMVRETERPAPQAAVVDGRLPSDPVSAERHAERVMATVRALLLAGTRVELETVEPGGEVVAPVASLLEAGRRLALALPCVETT